MYPASTTSSSQMSTTSGRSRSMKESLIAFALWLLTPFGKLERRLRFGAPLGGMPEWARHGPTPTSILAAGILLEVYARGGVMVSSNYAREKARAIAALASAGYLTTETYEPEDPYGRVWHPTAAGLGWLKYECGEEDL